MTFKQHNIRERFYAPSSNKLMSGSSPWTDRPKGMSAQFAQTVQSHLARYISRQISQIPQQQASLMLALRALITWDSGWWLGSIHCVIGASLPPTLDITEATIHSPTIIHRDGGIMQ